MNLSTLSFSRMEQSWLATCHVADAWFPAYSGSLEAREVQRSAKNLIRILAFHVRTGENMEQANMQTIRNLVEQEDQAVCSVIGKVRIPHDLDVGIVDGVKASRETGIGDPVPFLLLNLVNWRVGDVARRWILT